MRRDANSVLVHRYQAAHIDERQARRLSYIGYQRNSRRAGMSHSTGPGLRVGNSTVRAQTRARLQAIRAFPAIGARPRDRTLVFLILGLDEEARPVCTTITALGTNSD
jgi:hypothetical protein